MTNAATREGHQIFTTELTRFAERSADRQIVALIERLNEPLRVAVRGREGVGRGTVAAALTGAGVHVANGGAAADVDVLVVAEAVKPEDRAMLRDAPTLVVLNKADLAGFGSGGPLAVAEQRAASLRPMVGGPVMPMVGLLAAAELDDELLGALHVLTTEPADLTSTDGFLATEHSLPPAVRARLLNTLDLFGIAHCVLALRQGADCAALAGLLRRLSRLDEVLTQLTATGAQVRYQRVQSALAALRAMAAYRPAVAEFLCADDTVIAVMAAAVDVVAAAGLPVDRGDTAAAHLRRAQQWHRYSRGPVNALHRSCGTDIRRGSLRLLRGRAPTGTEAR